jgi:hypothetical protein
MARAKDEAPVAAEAPKTPVQMRGADGAIQEVTPDDLVEVRLVKNYVPIDGAKKPPYPGNDATEIVFERIPAGESILLPREEARRAIKLGIAVIDADLI